MSQASTLGELKRSGYVLESVKDEIRRNLAQKLARREPLFEGVQGYDDTVIPQVVNALLAKHNFILLGLRGQAKTRILRGLAELLDPLVPAIEGSELNDHPLAPVSKFGKEQIAKFGDATPIRWLPREDRYVEKLATPDVTIADLIGDIDPLKAAQQGYTLGSEASIHFGLLPRANRGIFAMNEVPDLAPKIQVGLFNIMEEGDIQIKGFPIRLALDVLMVFSANPQDYTARGKIVTPLKDRIGSEIRTHYPTELADGIKITEQEAWTNRGKVLPEVHVSSIIREVVEKIVFLAREDRRIDSRSGVSQRLSITLLESLVSNAERRMLINDHRTATARISDVYASLPAITGKLELEYEGEQIGADKIAQELIRGACAEVLAAHFVGSEFKSVVDFFGAGHSLSVPESADDATLQKAFESVPGLLAAASSDGTKSTGFEILVRAELILEGLYAQKRVMRRDEGATTTFGKAKPVERRKVVAQEEDDSDPRFN